MEDLTRFLAALKRGQGHTDRLIWKESDMKLAICAEQPFQKLQTL